MKILLATTDSVPSRYIATALLKNNYCHAILIDTFEDRKNRPPGILKKLRKHYRRGGFRDLFYLLKSYSGIGREARDESKSLLGEVLSWDAIKEKYNVGLTFVPSINSDASSNFIKSVAPDMGVIYGGRIVESAILDLPGMGFINKHSSLLPGQRGPQAEFWTLYKEEFESLGVTIHEATVGLDAGAILLQERMVFELGDTPTRLREKSHLLGANLLVEALGRVENGSIEKIVQDEGEASVNGIPSLSQVAAFKRKLPYLWEKYGKTSCQ